MAVVGDIGLDLTPEGRAAMERLNERERYIINLRFFEGKTQMEVAEEIAISQAQVSRLEKNALRIMKQYLTGK